MRRRRHIRVREATGMQGWGEEHPGFPWFGVHPIWHVLFIWPAIAYGLSVILRGPQQRQNG